jgi:hypothetical protein
MTYTHSYALLEVSQEAYDEIAKKLREAGYDHAFMDDGEVDMHGIALVPKPQETKR